MFGISAFAQTPFSTLASKLLLASASVTGLGDVSAQANVEYTGNASVHGNGFVTAYANATWSANGSVLGVANVIANGAPIGRNWTPIPIEDNTWNQVAISDNGWTEVTSNTNTWNRQG
jgi:hypothetical protein